MMYTVNKTPLVWIPMRDGIKLAAKLWMPVKSEKDEKFPAILGITLNFPFQKTF